MHVDKAFQDALGDRVVINAQELLQALLALWCPLQRHYIVIHLGDLRISELLTLTLGSTMVMGP